MKRGFSYKVFFYIFLRKFSVKIKKGCNVSKKGRKVQRYQKIKTKISRKIEYFKKNRKSKISKKRQTNEKDSKFSKMSKILTKIEHYKKIKISRQKNIQKFTKNFNKKSHSKFSIRKII